MHCDRVVVILNEWVDVHHLRPTEANVFDGDEHEVTSTISHSYASGKSYHDTYTHSIAQRGRRQPNATATRQT